MSDPQQQPHRLPPYMSQQPSGQPEHQGHAAQGYALNAQSPQPGRTALTSTNPAGRAGLIIGLVGLVIGVLVNLFVQVMIRTGGFAVVSIFSTFGSLIAFAAALTALILGLVGLRRIGAPHGAAGIAAGLGIAGVVNILFGFIISGMDWLLYF